MRGWIEGVTSCVVWFDQTHRSMIGLDDLMFLTIDE